MKNRYAATLLVVFVTLSFYTLTAAAGWVRGKVVEAGTKEPFQFVNISITRPGSTDIVNAAVTDADGNFKINIANGSYQLNATYIGYQVQKLNFSISTDKPNVTLKTILLKEDSKMLNEVQVTGQKSSMKFEIDKKVFNVDQTIANTGGSASDVLKNVPSVEVDNEGTVSLRGSESVTVWINGKAAGLSSDNQGSILEQMPAESIEKIEVITNPSAKYSPEGTAGIINIVLKRDRKAGYYGSVQAGVDSRGGYNAGANINYTSGPLEAYANVSYRHHKFVNGGHSDAEYYGADTTYQHQSTDGNMKGGMFFGRAGLTWNATDKDHIYTNFMGMTGTRNEDNTVKTTSGILGAEELYNRNRITSGDNDNYMLNFELGYKHEFATDHYLDFMVSSDQWKSTGNTAYDQTTNYTQNGTSVNSYQYQHNKFDTKETELQLDYSYKINDNNKLEAGYKSSFSRENSPVETYYDRAHEQVEQSLWNRFIYNEDIHALYATYSGRIKNFGYQAGLRGEYWKVNTKSLAYGEARGEVPYTTHEYFKLFPSLFLSYSLPHGNEIQVNYTRRLRRPWGGQLNNFKNISDSTNISFGNPDLTPEYSNAYELNYIKTWENSTLSFSGYYRTTDDEIERIRYTNGNVIYTTQENVAKSQSAGAEIVSKNTLFKAIDLTTTVDLFYYKLDPFSYTINNQLVTGEADENFSWNARMMASVVLPAAITMQVTGRYDARRVVAQGYRKANYSLDLGLRKSFLNNKISLALSGRDILDSRRFKSVTNGTGFKQDSQRWHGGREVSLTVTYNFGNARAKKMEKKRGDQNGDQYNDNGGMNSYGGEGGE